MYVVDRLVHALNICVSCSICDTHAITRASVHGLLLGQAKKHVLGILASEFFPGFSNSQQFLDVLQLGQVHVEVLFLSFALHCVRCPGVHVPRSGV